MQASLYDDINAQLQDDISNQNLQLPMLSQVTSQVLILVNDADSNAGDLSKLIQSDQALAGHVMRIANSAAYSPVAKMTSLQQAITRLGMQTIAEIAMAATMGPKLFVVPGFETFIADLWLSSLSIAVWSKEVARGARHNVESAFLSGLLFQIGRPAVLQVALKYCQQHSQTLDIATAEQLINAHQQEVGLVLAQQWQLPMAVVDTIRKINDSALVDNGGPVANAVRAASAIVSHYKDLGAYDLDALVADPAIMAMNMYRSDVEGLLKKAEAIKETIEVLTL